MVTTKENTNNALASGNQAIASTSKSWFDISEEFSAALNEKNAFANEDGARYFVIKRKDGDFTKTSPFLIQKAIQSIVGDAKSIKKLRSGDLLIEIRNNTQASNLKKCTNLANIPVEITTHRTLNSCRGVISEPDLQYINEEEILENLKDQKVTHVYRIEITRDNKKIPTKHLILTFATTVLPKSIKAGYMQCSVRPYIPNPLRCFNCQRYGHSKISCRGHATCGRCGAVGHDSSNCNDSPRCVNCKENHPSYARSCPKWILEKEIQTIRTNQNLSYPEARKIVETRTPSIGVTYAATASKNIQKSCRSIATQTCYQGPVTFRPHENKDAQSLSKNNSVPSTSNIQSQSTKANTIKLPLKPMQSTQTSKPVAEIPSVNQQKTKGNSNKKLPVKQVHKQIPQKNLPLVKSSFLKDPPAKKLRNQKPTANTKKKSSIDDEDAIALHASESSGDDMSTDDDSKVDVII